MEMVGKKGWVENYGKKMNLVLQIGFKIPN